MMYRRLGRTNLKVSVIGIGGGVFNRSKDPSITLSGAKEIVNLTVKNGINFIDMGKEYDEKFIGEAIGEQKGELYTITRSESRNAEELKKDVKDSIKKLGVSSIDVYEIMVESEEDLKNRIKEGVIDALREAKFEGIIKFTGIFSHKIKVLKEAIKTNEFDVVSTIYNAVHRMAEEIFPLKEKYKFGFIAAAPFATGILVDPKYDKNVCTPMSKYMTAENALKFVLSSEYVDATVIGIKNPVHIMENVNIGSEEWKLTKKERDNISKKSETFLGKTFCRMCRYCEGYQGVSIADILKLLVIAKCYGYVNFAKWQYSSVKERIVGKDFSDSEKICPYNLPINKMIIKLQKLIS
jgi:predicted aldo/keto reductase-like oxidoreductase